MKALEQRRKRDRKRQKRWREKKLAQGHKQIQIMLTPESQDALSKERERTGESYVQIINRAIVEIGKDLPDILDEIEVWHPG